MVISSHYKDTLNKFIDSSDLKSSIWLRQIDKRSHNALISENSLADFLKKNFSNKNFSDMWLQLEPKTQDL